MFTILQLPNIWNKLKLALSVSQWRLSNCENLTFRTYFYNWLQIKVDPDQVAASKWTDWLAALPQIPSVIINPLTGEWSPLSSSCPAASAVLCDQRDKGMRCSSKAGAATTCQWPTLCQCHLKLWLHSLIWAPSTYWASLTFKLSALHSLINLHLQ